jgi:hypothetical protein
MTLCRSARAARPDAASSVASIALLAPLPASLPPKEHQDPDGEEHFAKPS